MEEIQKILELLYDYTKENKKVDNKFIEKTCEMITTYRGLEGYIEKLNIINNNEEIDYIEQGLSGKFNILDGTLTINPDEAGQTLFKQFNNIDVSEKLLAYNIGIVFCLLHEFEHIEQYDYCLYFEKNSINEILTAALEPNLILVDFMNGNLKITDDINIYIDKRIANALDAKLYLYNPSERMADHDALQKLTQILDKIKDIKQLKLLIKYLQFQNKFSAFLQNSKGELISPTEKFITMIEKMKINGMTDEIIHEKIVEMSKNSSLEERIYLGLIIQDKEFKEQIEKHKDIMNLGLRR